MTQNKAQKQEIRQRMEKTGEQYTAARAQLMAKEGNESPVEPTPAFPGTAENPVYALHMSSDAIRKGSGKGWAEWLEILDAAGAYRMNHNELSTFVHDELGVDWWWAHGVALGYDRIRGKRAPGQREGGSFTGSASKTMPVSVDDLQAMWTDDDQRNAWLPSARLQLRTSVQGKSARFDDLESGAIIAVYFVDKGEAKASVSVQHDNLSSREEADEFRVTWKAHMDKLTKVLKDR